MTRNKEDYLKIIYELGGQYNRVSNKSISEALGVSAPSVSEMINKLLKDGYIEYTLYRGVILTEVGLERAMEIKRRHLLWEVFLVEKLGYNWEDVHEEAEKLEHVTSPKLEEFLDRFLDYPKFCPHGSPIRNKEEDYLLAYSPINTLGLEEEAVVRRFKDNKELLRFTKDINLEIGNFIQVLNIDKEKQIINILNNGHEIKIDFKFAEQIYVE